MDTIKGLITEDLLGKKYPFFENDLKIFGYLPQIDDLPKPSMSVIKSFFKESEVIGNPESIKWQIPCNKIRIVSLTAENLKLSQFLLPHDLILIGSSSEKRINKILDHHRTLPEGQGIGGIIITCGDIAPLNSETRQQIIDSNIPAILVKELTASAEEIVLKCKENTKLQIFDTHKVEEIKDLFSQHFDFEKFMESFKLYP
jgi:hypothetical protein